MPNAAAVRGERDRPRLHAILRADRELPAPASQAESLIKPSGGRGAAEGAEIIDPTGVDEERSPAAPGTPASNLSLEGNAAGRGVERNGAGIPLKSG